MDAMRADERAVQLEVLQSYVAALVDSVDDGVISIIDGDDATAIFVLNMTKGWTVPTADYFRFEDGRISMIKPYFDTAIFATDPPTGAHADG